MNLLPNNTLLDKLDDTVDREAERRLLLEELIAWSETEAAAEALEGETFEEAA